MIDENTIIVECDVEVILTGKVKVKVWPDQISQARGNLNAAAGLAIEDGYDDAAGRSIIPRLDIGYCDVSLARPIDPV